MGLYPHESMLFMVLSQQLLAHLSGLELPQGLKCLATVNHRRPSPHVDGDADGFRDLLSGGTGPEGGPNVGSDAGSD
jgi:hypothetical protein